MSRPAASAAILVATALLAGCGKSDSGRSAGPAIGAAAHQAQAAKALGFPVFATKNTTRVGGADPIADAAGVAQAVFNSASPLTRPNAVVLADANDWRGAIAAALLMSAPLHAPLLLSDGGDIPAATRDALDALKPRGIKQARGAQVIRIGDAPAPSGFKSTRVQGSDGFTLAQAIDRFQSAANDHASDRVVVASADAPAFAMPAAAWAAKGGDPVLYVRRDQIPSATRAAIVAHQQPRIYVLGPEAAVSAKVERDLRRLGTVTRISGPDPARNAIAFARFVDGSFGWGVVDPGHGLVFANAARPSDAGAAAPLSASGTYGPLLVVPGGADLPRSLEQYLLDIQPGFQGDPVRGVYNHGWLIGDQKALSVELQSRIDALLEIVPVNETGR